jgi:transposase-like protein
MKKDNQPPDEEEINLFTLAQEYADEDRAIGLLESMRWPDGVACPHCAAQKSECKDVYRLRPREGSKRPGRKGLWKCAACRKQFTVKVGTVFEASHIPISKWLMAVFIISSAKKGISSHQLGRTLKISYKSAWFMTHRIRYAMNESPFDLLTGTVEVDETYVGGKGDRTTVAARKTPVVALIERGGKARTQVVADVTGKTLRAAITASVSKDAIVNTDSASAYRGTLGDYKGHHVVNHSGGEYARKNFDGSLACTNTAESFFSLLKRGIIGSFHHVSREHLHRYATEFEFRWNNRKVADGKRMEVAISQAEGKRLTYKRCV